MYTNLDAQEDRGNGPDTFAKRAGASVRFFVSRTYRSAVGLVMATMILGRGIGYLRQLLIAYYFGVSRGLDIYFMAYAIATVIVIPFTSWFDQIVVPRLIQTREAK